MSQISPACNRFVLHWGEMARSWGISKTMGQVHALLYITGREWSAEDIMEELGVSRGNVSMTLRELVNWGLVTRVHHRGERREFYLAEQDVWEIFHRIIAERKRREVDPTHIALEECAQLLGEDPSPDALEVQQRLERLQEFFTAIDALYQRFVPHSKAEVDSLSKMMDANELP